MSLINKAAVREAALDVARRRFHNIPDYGFERVSPAFLERAERALAAWVEREVRAAPAVGKTLK
jgi:hypothetical protein